VTLCDEKDNCLCEFYTRPLLKYEFICCFKPKHECFDVIIYRLSASCDVFTCYIH